MATPPTNSELNDAPWSTGRINDLSRTYPGNISGNDIFETPFGNGRQLLSDPNYFDTYNRDNTIRTVMDNVTTTINAIDLEITESYLTDTKLAEEILKIEEKIDKLETLITKGIDPAVENSIRKILSDLETVKINVQRRESDLTQKCYL